MSHFSSDDETVVEAMGTADFSSTRKDNAPVPKKKLLQALSAKAIVVMVNAQEEMVLANLFPITAAHGSE